MENWLLYFAKVNGLIVLFYVMYVLFLRKETFFKSNRLYLILGLISSFIFPLITFTKTVWVESKPVIFDESISSNSIFVENIAPIEDTFNWNEVLIFVYLLISILVLIKITIEVVSFFKSIQNQDRKNEENYTLINSSQHENPFSFFNYIIINHQQFSEEELNHILIHESIHVKQKHSFDVLFSRIICAILWINPVIWLYRKAIIQNLEFIADNETFLIINNKHAYQKTLLKVVISNNQSTITNQFFQSLIKKRIVMLNTNQSHKKKSWKYAVILPFLIAFTLLFQIETVAQTKETKVEENTYAVSSSYSSILTKNTTDLEIKELQETFSGENHKLIISNVKRNKNNEIIAIKLEFDYGKTYNRVLDRKSEKPIDNIKIYINSDEDDDDLAYGFEEVDITPLDVLLVEEKKPKEKHLSMDNLTRNGKEIILIINGNVKGAEEKVKIDLDDELSDMKEISASEFEKKYNKKADKNKLYYEIETVNTVNISTNKNKVVIGSYKNTDEVFKNDDATNKLYIINGKEYLKSELPKGTTISLEGSITDLDKEEGIKRYGQKGKDGVLIVDGTAKFISSDEKIKSSENLEKNKELELKAQENSKLTESEREERMKERNEKIDERNKLLEERKKKMEERKKELEKKQ
jgi:beta-lactamase regulating signal transducer with metallopeptidase domain